MSISAFTGLPGSGKSYGVVENVILSALKKKRKVITNIPLNIDALQKDFEVVPDQFDTSTAQETPDFFDNLPAGAVIIIDEAWNFWPAGMKATAIPQSDKAFFAKHRHKVGDDGYSTEIYLCTQDLADVASFVRNKVETTYRSEKLSSLGFSKKYRIDVYRGQVTGQLPPKKLLMRSMFGTYKKTVYQYYISHTESEGGLVGDETKSDSRATVWRSAAVWLVIPVAILAFVFGVYAISGLKQMYGMDDAEQLEVTTNAVETPAAKEKRERRTRKQDAFQDILADYAIYISANFGKYPAVKYVFSATDKEKSFRFEGRDLIAMGYSMTPINECLVILETSTHSLPVTCKIADTPFQQFEYIPGAGAEDFF